MNRSLSNLVKSSVVYISVSPCSPLTLHRSWHQHLTCRNLPSIKFRRRYSADEFSHITGYDGEEVAKALSIHANAIYGPSQLELDDLRELLLLKDSSKLSHLRYLFVRERRRTAAQFRALFSPLNPPKKVSLGLLFDEQTHQPIYGLANNNLIHNFSVTRLANVWHSSLFGSKLVFDFSYDHLMRSFEQKSLARQLQRISFWNQKLSDPFDLIFSNFSGDEEFLKEFIVLTHGLSPSDTHISVNEKPVHELFARQDIIYLSPDGDKYLTHFEPDKIYVIGGLVDTWQTCNHASRDYCHQHSLTTAKLPLDRLPVNVTAIRFTLTAIVDILHSMSHGEDVITSIMKHMAPRKTLPHRQIRDKRQITRKRRSEKFALDEPLFRFLKSIPRRQSVSAEMIEDFQRQSQSLLSRRSCN